MGTWGIWRPGSVQMLWYAYTMTRAENLDGVIRLLVLRYGEIEALAKVVQNGRDVQIRMARIAMQEYQMAWLGRQC